MKSPSTPCSDPHERAAAIAVLDRGATPPPAPATGADTAACDADHGEHARLRHLAIELGRAVDA